MLSSRKYNISLFLKKRQNFQKGNKMSQHDILFNFVLTSLLENVYILFFYQKKHYAFLIKCS